MEQNKVLGQKDFILINDIVEGYSRVMWKRVLGNMINSTIDEFYLRTGKPRDGSRMGESVKARAAIACALTNRFRIIDVANCMKLHHATVIHHRKNHESNMDYWKGYKEVYEAAKLVMSTMPFASQLQKAESENQDWVRYLRIQKDRMQDVGPRKMLMDVIKDDFTREKAQLFDDVLLKIQSGESPADAINEVIREAINKKIVQ
jgi:hypothetical protein